MTLTAALFQTLVQLGGSFGLSVTSVIGNQVRDQSSAAGNDDVTALLIGEHAAYYTSAAFSFAALLLAGVMLRGLGIIVKPKPGHPPVQRAVEAETSDRTDVEKGPTGSLLAASPGTPHAAVSDSAVRSKARRLWR